MRRRQLSDREDVHQVGPAYERAMRRIETGEGCALPPEVRREIASFIRHQEDLVSIMRLKTYTVYLPSVAQKLGPQFLAPTRETPQKFRQVFRDYQVWSLDGAWGCARKFWSWRYERNGEDFPSWLKLPIPKKFARKRGPDDVFTPADVAKIAEHCTNLRDKAFVWTLFESGARPGELAMMTVGDVKRKEPGYLELRTHREKGSAAVPVYLFEQSVPALLAWLQEHPGREDPRSPLWVGIHKDNWGKHITYRNLYRAVVDAGIRAGLEKPLNPYNFRHSRATALAKDATLSRSTFERIMGWRPGSPMAEVYVHMSGRDVEEALLRKHGLMKAEEADATKPQHPRTCSRCRTSNAASAKFCHSCGGPLEVNAVVELTKVEQKADVLGALLETPEVQKVLSRKLAELMRQGKIPG